MGVNKDKYIIISTAKLTQDMLDYSSTRDPFELKFSAVDSFGKIYVILRFENGIPLSCYTANCTVLTQDEVEEIISTEERWTSVDTPSVYENIKSLIFNGTDEAINFGQSLSSLSLTDKITLIAWIKTDTDQNGVIFGSHNAGFSKVSFYLQLISSNRITFTVSQAGSSSDGKALTVTAPSTYSNNSWHMIAAVLDITEDFIKIFFDGNLVTGTPAIDNTMTEIYQNAANYLSVGSYYDGSSLLTLFDGLINDIAIFNTDKSSVISDYYNSGTPIDLNGEEGLVLYSRLGDATSSTTQNSDVGADGTLINMTEIDNVVEDAP
jgi:hypothetical protein